MTISAFLNTKLLQIVALELEISKFLKWHKCLEHDDSNFPKATYQTEPWVLSGNFFFLYGLLQSWLSSFFSS